MNINHRTFLFYFTYFISDNHYETKQIVGKQASASNTGQSNHQKISASYPLIQPALSPYKDFNPTNRNTPPIESSLGASVIELDPVADRSFEIKNIRNSTENVKPSFLFNSNSYQSLRGN